MYVKRNKEQGFTEIYKGNKLFGISFSAGELWKLRVYIVYSGTGNNKSYDKKRRKYVV